MVVLINKKLRYLLGINEVFVLCPSSYSLKNAHEKDTTFLTLHLFASSDEEMEDTFSVGSDSKI
jgi:hypothetical protein